MRGRRVAAAAILVLAATACGPDRAPPADVGGGGEAGAATGTGGHAGGGPTGGTGATGTGGTGNAASGGAAGGGATPGTGGVVAECGNDVAELGEQCDGDDLGAWSCLTLGFDTGTLACTASCEVDYTDCSGTETCFDYRDNDGDRASDCADSDCASVCAAPCANAPVLPDPGVVEGTTVGRGALVEPSCRIGTDPTGPEVVYRFTALHTGVLEASVASAANLTVSLRTTCDEATSELGCAFGVNLERPVTEGDEVFVIVDGLTADTAGAFTLEVMSRTITCGDGYRDGDEQCDDGNLEGDDGCSAACAVEPTESADNDTRATADPRAEPFYASIDPVGDVDWVSFQVAAAPGAVTLDTFDLGDGACSLQLLDSAFELYDSAGSLVETDDDSGPGYCAHLAVGDLAAGTYYVRVFASPAGATPTFPYRLGVDVDPCGNGQQAEAEECDDGNRINWDGCSSACKRE